MPIILSAARDCYKRFREHVAEVVSATLSETCPLHCQIAPDDSCATLLFRTGETTTLPIRTRFGTLYFHLAQLLSYERDGRREYRLITKRYWYRVQESPRQDAPAFIRWEYDREHVAGKANPARHHVQFHDLRMPVAGQELDMNRAHIPTGWVTFEEVIRFLVLDLGVRPPCGDLWPEVLAESERKFYEEFTGKRYKRR